MDLSVRVCEGVIIRGY